MSFNSNTIKDEQLKYNIDRKKFKLRANRNTFYEDITNKFIEKERRVEFEFKYKSAYNILYSFAPKSFILHFIFIIYILLIDILYKF